MKLINKENLLLNNKLKSVSKIAKYKFKKT
jgi:hypothetical protein